MSEKCQVYLKHKRTPSRPKVGLPISSDFNDCVALDLKGPLNNKKYILYFIDTFSRLTRGVYIKDKAPATIVKGILDNWVIGKGLGPGLPGRFLFDCGGEFNNPQMIELAEKQATLINAVTAEYAPYSNGLCERNHAVVDIMIDKIKADDPSISDQEALDYA